MDATIVEIPSSVDKGESNCFNFSNIIEYKRKLFPLSLIKKVSVGRPRFSKLIVAQNREVLIPNCTKGCIEENIAREKNTELLRLYFFKKLADVALQPVNYLQGTCIEGFSK